MSTPAPPSPVVVDVTDATFQQEVIERSCAVPVVVDFWAPWCGPCRALAPVLERLAAEAEGAFVLAKVNTDENSEYAGQFGVRGIPAVKAFRGGELIAEFSGALPEAQVRTWLDDVVPNAAQVAASEAAELLAQGDLDAADTVAERVLATDPRQPLARLIRARVLLARPALDPGSLGTGSLSTASLDAARAHLDAMADPRELSSEVDRTRAQLTLARAAHDAGDEPALHQQLERDPKDTGAEVGIAAYQALAGAPVAAFERLVDLIGRRPSAKPAAHSLALAVLTLCPTEDQASLRRKLSMVLF